MAELVEITAALEQLKNFTFLQRMLLGCAGTLQATLSLYFGMEVRVRVRSQTVDDNGIIRRLAELHNGQVVVCEAQSQLTIQNPEVKSRVKGQDTGIGQVLEMLGIHTSFELDEVGQDDRWFWRRYTLRAPGVVYVIRERFPQVLYQPKDWPESL